MLPIRVSTRGPAATYLNFLADANQRFVLSAKCCQLQRDISTKCWTTKTVSEKLSNSFSTRLRSLQTSSWLKSSSISNVHVANDNQSVNLSVCERVIKIPFVWLRDHCRSDRYYNYETNQKNADPALLQRDLTPMRVALSESGEKLYISWKDGHESSFNCQWLQKNFYPGRFSRATRRKFWTREAIETQLPRVSHAEHMESDEGLKKTLANLVKYGFCLVDGAPPSLAGTQAVVERITFVQQTLFGGMWSFKSDGSRSDTAYSSLGLGAHTDTTYMELPSGIQVFQCLKHVGSGGKTLLVDGFRVLDELRETHPDDFQLLSQLVIPHEYKEPMSENSPGYHLYSLGTVIRLHPASGEIMQLRFNPYDRAPLNTVPPQQLEKFYKAYEKLERIVAKKEGELWIKLSAGSVLLIDNWRVMHGRSAFDGERVMCGCYLPRDEWVSKARMFGLL